MGRPELADFRLVGGTALALRLGHRFSVDLDLFADDSGEQPDDEGWPARLADALGMTVTVKRNTPAIKLMHIDGVKVDLVRYPYPWIWPAAEVDGVRIADIREIAAMKLSAVTNRGTRKDFVDLGFLLRQYALDEMLSFYARKYPDGSPFMVLRSLTYFDDADAEPMPRLLTPVDWEELKENIQNAVREYERHS